MPGYTLAIEQEFVPGGAKISLGNSELTLTIHVPEYHEVIEVFIGVKPIAVRNFENDKNGNTKQKRPFEKPPNLLSFVCAHH